MWSYGFGCSIKIKNDRIQRLRFAGLVVRAFAVTGHDIDGVNTCMFIKHSKDDKEVVLNPLPYVIKDLVPDMTNFYQQYKSIKPWLIQDKKINQRMGGKYSIKGGTFKITDVDKCIHVRAAHIMSILLVE